MYSNLSDKNHFTVIRNVSLSFAAILLVFIAWPGQFYFLNDDLLHIPLAAKGQIGHNNSIRYIGDLSLKLDSIFWGQKALGYHWTNLLLHLANTLLFYKVIQQVDKFLGLNPGSFIQIFAPILFCLYGFHSDAIFWVIGRSASLGCLFFLSTIFFFCRKQQSTPVILLISALWTAALFSYESVWILPVLLLLLYRFRGISLKKSQRHFIVLVLISFIFVVYLIYRQQVTSEWLGTYEAGEIVQMNVPVLAVNFFKLLFRSILPAVADTGLFIGLAISFMLGYGLLSALVLKRKSNRLAWLILHGCWLFSLAPYLSLGISIHTLESERFLYIPSLFLIMAISFTIDRLYVIYSKSLIFILPIALLGVHLFYLQKAAAQYRDAGNTVKATYDALRVIPAGESLEIENLPETIGGIPVFRKGFEEGGLWLLKDFESWNKNILSTANFPNGRTILVLKRKEKENRWLLNYKFSPI